MRAVSTDSSTPKSKAAEGSPSRPPRSSVELFGLSREELAAMGPERFEELLEEAIDREVAQKMAPFDAALGSARAMIESGRTDAALGLLRSAAAGLADDGLYARRVSQKFVRMLFGSRSERLDGEELQQLFFAFEGKPEAFDAAVAAGTTPTIPTPDPITTPVDRDEDQDDAAAAGADGAPPKKKKRPNPELLT
jgi:hypothetical protein